MSSAAAVSLGRQPCSRYRAVEQEHAKLVLKLTDTLTDDRLADIQLMAGGVEVRVPGCYNDASQVT